MPREACDSQSFPRLVGYIHTCRCRHVSLKAAQTPPERSWISMSNASCKLLWGSPARMAPQKRHIWNPIAADLPREVRELTRWLVKP